MTTLTAPAAPLAICGPKTVHETREGWLLAAVEALRPLFAEIGAEIPALRVSVGFPGGTGKKTSVIGQCWNTASAKDGVPNLFISPVLDDREKVLATLVHEVVHAVDDNVSGHAGEFRRMAKALGLVGKMTATTAGDDLARRLNSIMAELGTYPHGAMRQPMPKGKGRMRKISCPRCEFIAYTSDKWIQTYYEMPCACGGTIRPA